MPGVLDQWQYFWQRAMLLPPYAWTAGAFLWWDHFTTVPRHDGNHTIVCSVYTILLTLCVCAFIAVNVFEKPTCFEVVVIERTVSNPVYNFYSVHSICLGIYNKNLQLMNSSFDGEMFVFLRRKCPLLLRLHVSSDFYKAVFLPLSTHFVTSRFGSIAFPVDISISLVFPWLAWLLYLLAWLIGCMKTKWYVFKNAKQRTRPIVFPFIFLDTYIFLHFMSCYTPLFLLYYNCLVHKLVAVASIYQLSNNEYSCKWIKSQIQLLFLFPLSLTHKGPSSF